MTAVAHQVDDHVALELFAECVGQARDLDHRLRIVAIDVQHRCVDHLGKVGAVHGRARVLRIGRGETDLVVDHDVQGTADPEAARLRHVDQLHVDALAGERRIAVNEHGHGQPVPAVTPAGLPRVYRAGDDSVDDFQV